MNEDQVLVMFKNFCNFINVLEEEYGKKHRPLKLYKRLVNKTQISHTKIIKKHITAFTKFFEANKEAFYDQDESKIEEKIIEYSSKVFVDISKVFTFADKDTKKVIWKHLLGLAAFIDSSGKCKEMYKNSNSKEDEFISDIFSKVEQTVDPNANPMEAFGSIMNSGLFQDIQNGSNPEQMDVGKLLGSVQGMINNLKEQAGNEPGSEQAMGMLDMMSGIVGNLGNGQQPDMTGMMSMMMGAMSGGGNMGELAGSINNNQIDYKKD